MKDYTTERSMKALGIEKEKDPLRCHRKKRATIITWNGRSLTTTEWGKETGLGANLVYQRFKVLGWSAQKTLTTNNQGPGRQ